MALSEAYRRLDTSHARARVVTASGPVCAKAGVSHGVSISTKPQLDGHYAAIFSLLLETLFLVAFPHLCVCNPYEVVRSCSRQLVHILTACDDRPLVSSVL